MNLADAVAAGRREGLTELRNVLAASFVEAPAGAIAPLAKQLADVMRELDSLPNIEAVNPIDELKAKRSRRRAASTDSAPAKVGDKRRPRGKSASQGGRASS